MIEILFTESAAGSMKLAKGIKNIVDSSTAVFIHSEDGAEISPEELEAERLRVEEEYRKKRENAIQVEGTPRDVACFPLNLSMGDILEPFSDTRTEYLQSTVMIGGPAFSRGMLTPATEAEPDRPIYHRYLRKEHDHAAIL